MSLATVAGMFLVVVPVALNVAFGLLAARFDYPVLQKAGADQGSRRSSRS